MAQIAKYKSRLELKLNIRLMDKKVFNGDLII